ncbi:MAG: rhodanese-like domain-containing protein [Dehalococcoidia bacterium]
MKKLWMVVLSIPLCLLLVLAGCIQTETSPEPVPVPAPSQDSIAEPGPETQQPETQQPKTQQPETQQPETQPSPSEMVPRITVEELLKKMEQNEDVLVIDTRKGVETAYPEGHIPGAMPVTLETIVSGEWMLPGDKDREIILYCT